MEILSIIVPCYNEEEVLPIFYKETTEVLKNMDIDYEIIYVDDGSKDNSLKICKEYEKKNDSIVVVHQEVNRSHEATPIDRNLEEFSVIYLSQTR